MGGLDIGMSKHRLNCIDVRAKFQLERCIRMSGAMEGYMFSLKKKLGIAKVICKPLVLVPKTAQESSLSKLGEMAHV